ncbi:MAG: T9SS type A sorting domain-containing protein [Terrimonas sp.]|nr:T9SS type A sorting domain-containing protein [Terrimonas sp.]
MKKIIFYSIMMAMSINSFSQGTWTQKADFMGGDRYGTFHFSIGNKGYIGTGSDNAGIFKSDFWEYDPQNDTWTQKADFGGGIRFFGTGFSIGNKGYAGTGVVASYNWRKDMWQYDPESNTWTQIADFGGGLRFTAVGFGIGDKGYMGTGNYRISPAYPATYYNDWWEYNPSTNLWTRKANVPQQGRTNAAGTSINGKGYVGTGFYYYDTRLNDWWEYDPLTDTWVQKASLPATPRYAASAITIGNKGYLGGGIYYSNFNDFWEYDPTSNNWKQEASLPASERNSTVAFGIGHKGYFGLGSNNIGALHDFWVFNPYEVSLSCNEDISIAASDISCNSIVNNIDPIITVNPADFTPDVQYTLYFNGQQVGSGTGTASGQTFEKGITTVTYSLVEYPEQNCSFNITVSDQTPPYGKLLIKDKPVCYNPTNAYELPDLYVFDNCGIQNVNYAISGATNRTGDGTNASGVFNPGTNHIVWTMTDNDGNTGTFSYDFVVLQPIVITIPDVYAVNPGGNPNTLYIGYGPTALSLTVLATGGGIPGSSNSYNFEWSTDETTATISVNPALPGMHPYTVMVTDNYQCTTSLTKNIEVIDIRCGNKLDKVTLCKVPPGNPSNGHDNCVSKAAVPVLLANGSHLGNCNTTTNFNSHSLMQQVPETDSRILTVYPNPNQGIFTVIINIPEDQKIAISIIDQQGRKIITKQIENIKGSNSIQFNMGTLSKGVYTIQALAKSGIITTKMIVQ